MKMLQDYLHSDIVRCPEGLKLELQDVRDPHQQGREDFRVALHHSVSEIVYPVVHLRLVHHHVGPENKRNSSVVHKGARTAEPSVENKFCHVVFNDQLSVVLEKCWGVASSRVGDAVAVADLGCRHLIWCQRKSFFNQSHKVSSRASCWTDESILELGRRAHPRSP